MTTLTPAETKDLTTRLNQGLAWIGRKFHCGMPLREIVSVLCTNGVDPAAVYGKLAGDKGKMNVEVAPDVFLFFSWERRESGNFEVNVYASSQHDDYREPYTKVMTTKERNAAKKAANKHMPTGNETFKGKSYGFCAVEEALRKADLDTNEFFDVTMSGQVAGDDGRVMGVSVGNGLFVTCSWYRRESGNYEIIGYVS